MNNVNDNGRHKTVTSLRDLPPSVLPSRDLWAGIESQITAQAQSEQHEAPQPRRYGARNPANVRWLAAAAMVATLAVGMWIGRTLLPTMGPVAATNSGPGMAGPGMAGPGTATHAPQSISEILDGGGAFQAAYFADPKLVRTRAELLKSVEAKFKSLPPDTQQKVISSLQTIHQSMKDLEAALGKDPSNALLQELLVNTYQDEMRVLTTVHEAGTDGEGI
jgi:hypothetical protein